MYLVIDCYLDDEGGAKNIRPLLQNKSVTVWRPTREPPISDNNWSGVVITGSGACIANGYQGHGMRNGWMEELSEWLRTLAQTPCPVLGLCFGHQVLGYTFGGTVFKRTCPEVGVKEIQVHNHKSLFKGFSTEFCAFVSHEDELDTNGQYQVLASTPECPVHSIKINGLPFFGVQFHVEMDFEEAQALLYFRQNKHQNLEMNLDAEISKLNQYVNQRHSLFNNFLDFCDDWTRKQK